MDAGFVWGYWSGWWAFTLVVSSLSSVWYLDSIKVSNFVKHILIFFNTYWFIIHVFVNKQVWFWGVF